MAAARALSSCSGVGAGAGLVAARSPTRRRSPAPRPAVGAAGRGRVPVAAGLVRFQRAQAGVVRIRRDHAGALPVVPVPHRRRRRLVGRRRPARRRAARAVPRPRRGATASSPAVPGGVGVAQVDPAHPAGQLGEQILRAARCSARLRRPAGIGRCVQPRHCRRRVAGLRLRRGHGLGEPGEQSASCSTRAGSVAASSSRRRRSVSTSRANPRSPHRPGSLSVAQRRRTALTGTVHSGRRSLGEVAVRWPMWRRAVAGFDLDDAPAHPAADLPGQPRAEVVGDGRGHRGITCSPAGRVVEQVDGLVAEVEQHVPLARHGLQADQPPLAGTDRARCPSGSGVTAARTAPRPGRRTGC